MSSSKPAKTKKVSVRFTERQLDLVHARADAAGINRTAYIQHQALKATEIEFIPRPTVNTGQMLILKELRIQGNNLNQIAKGINRANLSGQTMDNYQQPLAEIKNELERLSPP